MVAGFGVRTYLPSACLKRNGISMNAKKKIAFIFIGDVCYFRWTLINIRSTGWNNLYIGQLFS